MEENKILDSFTFRLSDKKSKQNDENDFFSTRSRCLNEILSGHYRCGIKKGRMYEISGWEGSGKTTFCLEISADATSKKCRVDYIDLECALDKNYVLSIGNNSDYFYISQPDCTEEAFDVAYYLIKEKGSNLIIFDSVARMFPRAEIEGEMEKEDMGLRARKINKGIVKLVSMLSSYNVGCVFINQFRNKIGGFGRDEVTTGGNGLRFFSSVRIEVRSPRGGKIIESKGSLDDIKKSSEVGIQANFKTIKNKLFIPYQDCSVNIKYGKGFDKNEDFVSFLGMKGIINIESNKKLKYDGKNYLKSNFIQKMVDDKEFKKKILSEMNKCYNV